MQRNTMIGLGAAAAAALTGAGWQLVSRYGVTTTLGPMEITVLRYGVPGLILLPLWWRLGLRPRGIGWGRLAVLVAGGGLPFGLLVLAGAQMAPAAHIGVFLAGCLPVFTALACRLVLGEAITAVRYLGFGLILVGVGWLGLTGLADAVGAWRGDLLFLGAALAWSAHTLAYRGSGLSPWEGAAVVNGTSALAVALVLPFWGAPRLLTAPLADVLIQALGQGVMAGLLGLIAYMAAVTRLGSARAALSAALVPLLTATGAAWLLGEPLSLPTLAAAVLAALGVALASGAITARPARGRAPA